MTDWQPKPGGAVMVVNPKGLDLTKEENDIVGTNVIFHTVVESESGSIPIGVVEDGCADFYCFRMDMIAQPVDPRRAVLEALASSLCCVTFNEKDLARRSSEIDCALSKLDDLPPF